MKLENKKKLVLAYLQRMLPLIGLICLLALGYGIYYYSTYEDTTSADGYVNAEIINVTPQVSGLIQAIFVSDNQLIKKGDKLFQIDPTPYNYAVDLAEANFDNAMLSFQKDKSAYTENKIKALKAELDLANYNLKNTIVYASQNGYITNMHLKNGQFVNKNLPLFALVVNKEWWIVASYRETTLRLIKPGAKVIIHINMYPSQVFHGVVESIDWGINRQQASLNVVSSSLPYIEPTENWIRIPQRFRVFIRILDPNPAYPLRIGASATTTIK